MATSTTGLSGDNLITGTDGADKLIGGGGSDTIDGGSGSDFINAGGGNDTIIYDELDYKILGGGGIDTLWFKSGGQQLKLGSNVVSGIEKLWLDGGGWNQVWLGAADIVRVSDNDQMIISGHGNDLIYLTDTGWKFDGLSADNTSQVLSNGMAKIIVELPVYVDGFSNNSSIDVQGIMSLTEDSKSPTLTTNGTLTVTDPNPGQGLLLGGDQTLSNGFGSLKISQIQPWSASGPATYALTYSISNDSVQHLAAGKQLIDSFLVRTIDGSSTFVSFTTNGVNDPATIGTPDVVSVTEDSYVGAGNKLYASGNISIADVDDGENGFSTTVTSAAGNLGSLTLGSDGSYTYSVDNGSVQYLGAGKTKTDNFTIKSLDGTSKDISFTINGANDPAKIGDMVITPLTEDQNLNVGFLTLMGTLSVNDPDAGENLFRIQGEPVGSYLGSLTLSPEGAYVYAISNIKVQYLKTGEFITETFTVKTVDGTGKNFTFTINGADDPAVIRAPALTDVTEDQNVVSGFLTRTGNLFVSDPDHDESGFRTTVISSSTNLGNLQLASDGNFTYSVSNSDVQYLKTGESKVDTFTVTSIDGTTKDISFTINGVDDGTIIGNPDNDSVVENQNVDGTGRLTATGYISISSSNPTGASFKTNVQAATGDLGTLTLNSDGKYTYTVLNSSVIYLGKGESKIDYFTVTSADGTSKQIAFTINGVDNVSIDASLTNKTVTEYIDGSTEEAANSTHIISDLVSANLVSTLTWTENSGNQPYLGKFEANLDSTDKISWSYQVDDKYIDYLQKGESLVQKYIITVSDGTLSLQKEIDVTLTGTSDSMELTDLLANVGGNLSGDQNGLIMRGMGGDDSLFYSGSGGRIYGDEGNDLILIASSNSLIRGGNGDDVLDIQSSASSGNEIYGDLGNDQFNFRVLNAQDVWGGPGADIFKVYAPSNAGASPIIHDFDVGKPSEGGDQIDLSPIGNPNFMNLALTATDPNHFELTTGSGASKWTIFTLIGSNLTMADLSDNIIGYTG